MENRNWKIEKRGCVNRAKKMLRTYGAPEDEIAAPALTDWAKLCRAYGT
jgi:hypothetical protein